MEDFGCTLIWHLLHAPLSEQRDMVLPCYIVLLRRLALLNNLHDLMMKCCRYLLRCALRWGAQRNILYINNLNVW